jgi:hydantoinase/carbamoylase family amidase
MLASGVFAGIHTQEYAYGRTDLDGKTFGEELARIGWLGDEVVGARKMHAMLELHIEQGPILEAEGKTIGVVTHGQGLWWLEITLTGKDAHTGSTPMNMRVNAGLGMARITEAVHRIAMSHQPNAVGAVGQVKVFPNSRNVIPGRVVFTVDIRSPEQGKLDLMRGEVERAAAAVAAELGLGCAIEPVGHFDPVTFDPGLVKVVRGAAEAIAIRERESQALQVFGPGSLCGLPSALDRRPLGLRVRAREQSLVLHFPQGGFDEAWQASDEFAFSLLAVVGEQMADSMPRLVNRLAQQIGLHRAQLILARGVG